MSLKDSFYQSVKELLDHGGFIGEDLEEKSREQSETDCYLEKPFPPAATNFDVFFERAEQNSAADQEVQPLAEPPMGSAMDEPPIIWVPKESDESEDPTMFVEKKTGAPTPEAGAEKVRLFANVTIEGAVMGRLEVTQDLLRSGLCDEESMKSGTLAVKGCMMLDADAVLCGDLNAPYAEIRGKIQGKLTLSEKIPISSDSGRTLEDRETAADPNDP